MGIIIAKNAGFCFGVKRAIDSAYDALNSNESEIYSIGPLIHNELVTADLKEKGLIVLNDYEEISKLKSKKVIIRTHGIEKNIYELSSNGEILTSDLLSSEYLKLNKKYFGDTIIYDENIIYEYARVPHFYNDFYVFTYASGICYATKIVKDILDNKENAIENYIKFLKTGGSMYPLDELKVAGIDALDKNVYLDTIKYFESIVDKFEELIKKVK